MRKEDELRWRRILGLLSLRKFREIGIDVGEDGGPRGGGNGTKEEDRDEKLLPDGSPHILSLSQSTATGLDMLAEEEEEGEAVVYKAPSWLSLILLIFINLNPLSTPTKSNKSQQTTSKQATKTPSPHSHSNASQRTMSPPTTNSQATTPPSSPDKITIGILLLGAGVQLLDLAAIDVLALLEKSYLAAVPMPQEFKSKFPGLDIDFHYITETGEGMHPLTAGGKFGVTDSIHTCPPLTHLLVPGPPPSYQPSAAIRSFIAQTLSSPSLRALLTVCTGIIPVLASGVLGQKKVTAPRLLIPGLQKQFADVQFVEKRWWRDGKVWTSGGVTNGLDMMAAFCREEFARGEAGVVVETVLGMADVGGRWQEYEG